MTTLAFACVALIVSMPGEKAYLDGRAAEHRDRFKAAAEAYSECANQEGPLSPYAKVRAAACVSRSGDAESALTLLQGIVEQAPGTPWARMAGKEQAEILVRLERHESAAAAFEKVLQASSDLPPLWWMDPYRWEAARNRLSVPRLRDVGYAFFSDQMAHALIPQKRLDAANILADSPELKDRIAAALGMLRAKAHEDAAKLAQRLTKSAKANPSVRVQWTHLTAQLNIASGNAGQGREALLKLALDNPGQGWVPPALLDALRNLIRRDDYEGAASVCARLHEAYPDSPQAGEARWQLATGYIKEHKPELAMRQLRFLAQHYPDHDRTATALLRIGRLLMEEGLHAEALQAYEGVAERYAGDESGMEGAFWAGMLLERRGKTADARERYRKAAVSGGVSRYYAHRAQERLNVLAGRIAPGPVNLGVAGGGSFVSPIPIAHGAPLDALNALAEDARFQRLQFFGRHGFEEAEWEALCLSESLDESLDSSLLYSAMGQAGTAYSAMQLVSPTEWGRDSNGDMTAERLRVRFPRAYWPLVLDAVSETGLDPYLILSVARRESTYRPALTSWAGAKGLMQLMPRTAKSLVDNEASLNRSLARNFEDPAASLILGASYLKRMVERSDGNVIYALASYNAGPANCDAWRKRFPDADMGIFIENIPFAETQEYVKRVLAYYAAYHSLYPPAVVAKP